MDETILIIENDQTTRWMIAESLFNEGYQIKLAGTDENVMQEFQVEQPDLVVLDFMQPDLVGVAFLEKLCQSCTAPVLILLDEAVEKTLKISLLNSHLIHKPFSIRALVEKVRELLQIESTISKGKEQEVYEPLTTLQFGELLIDKQQTSVVKAGVKVKLTATEFNLLVLLAESPGKVFTKESIHQAIWGSEYYASDENVINVHIRRLRQKIEKVPSKPQYIKTIWGTGYKFTESYR